MTRPDPGRVLRRALLGWGLGHLAIGRTSFGAALLASEVVAIGLVVWLTLGLADTSAYLVPYLAGTGFLVAWGWQAVAAYRAARGLEPEPQTAPPRSPALAISWLALPLLLWGAGYWLVGASAASPEAALDRFVTAWSADAVTTEEWPSSVVDAARRAGAEMEPDADRFRDIRLRVADGDGERATAVAEAIHYERRDSRFLWIFAGSELVPVADRQVLTLELVARPAELPGGGDIGAVRWEIVDADAG